jgi:hypothetical protein
MARPLTPIPLIFSAIETHFRRKNTFSKGRSERHRLAARLFASILRRFIVNPRGVDFDQASQ